MISKRLKNALLSFTVAATMAATLLSPISAKAEVLQTQQMQSATTLLMGAPIESSIPSMDESDHDFYSFTMPGSGYVIFSVENMEFVSEHQDGWRMLIYNSAGTELKEYHNPNDSQISKSGRYNFKRGDTLYIRIAPKYPSTVNKTYAISASFTGTTSWESEANDDFSTATYLAAGKARCGTSYIAYDKDYYSFVPKGGTGTRKVKLNFSLATAIKETNGNQDSFEISIFDSTKKEICKTPGNITKNYSISFSVTPGKKYYILVTSHGSNAVDALYKLKIAYKK